MRRELSKPHLSCISSTTAPPLSLLLGKVCRVEHAVINIDITAIITCNRISTPKREWPGNTTSTSHSKCQHEDTHLGSTIQSSGDEVIPLNEVFWLILPEIPLSKDSNDV